MKGLKRIKGSWEELSVSREGVAQLLQQYGLPPSWGTPVAAKIWEENVWKDDECDSRIKAIVADFPNGKRADFRQIKKSWHITFGKIPS